MNDPNLYSYAASDVIPNMEYPRGRISNVVVRLDPSYIALAQTPGADPIHARFINALAQLQGGY